MLVPAPVAIELAARLCLLALCVESVTPPNMVVKMTARVMERTVNAPQLLLYRTEAAATMVRMCAKMGLALVSKE